MSLPQAPNACGKAPFRLMRVHRKEIKFLHITSFAWLQHLKAEPALGMIKAKHIIQR